MNLQKKTVIIGAIWGLVSAFWVFLAFAGGATEIKLWGKILTMPSTIFLLLFSEASAMPKFIYIFVLGSIIIGVFTGYGIAKIYLKLKE